ncbi:MAG: hypothetical protein KA270_14405 [Saprospiraceae bacterium]|jgi:hypothetical protein|nr:hypothetical protein [Saprospiraceae bacterium]MBP6239028.1 hypothetical protein [Saprospiraceae bacterium]MBP6568360.1 hypothetical protein [Saprospiraceae bacterium]MBP9197972.1 hypothetical protein [Saprospiraceae bacterium]
MRTVVFSLVVLFLASCAPSLKYYTKEIHDDSRWSDSELGKIQFYLSNDIFLWRDVNRGESVITNGKIKMVDGREVEEIVIKKGTPGAFLFSPQKNHYAVSFDNNDDSKYLIFGPSEKVNGRYVLLAKDWDRRFGKVTYGDKVYKTTNESAFAYLMVDVDKTRRTKVSTTKAPGRKVE